MKAWRKNLTAAWIAQFLCIVGFSTLMAFLPFFVQTLGVTELHDVEMWSGLLNTGGAVSMTLFAPIWGALADRFGSKMMVERAAFAGAITVAIRGFSTNVHQLLATRIIEGAFTGTVSAFVTLVALLAPEGQVGQGLGLMQVAVYAGSSLGPLIGGLAADAWGFRAVFWLAAAMLLAGALLVHFVVQNPPRTTARTSGAAGGLKQVVSTMWRSGPILATLAVLFVANIANSNVQPILPLYVASLGVSPERASSASGLVQGATAVASAIAAVVACRLADRHGYRAMLALCSLGAALTFIPQALAGSVVALLAARFANGLFVGGTLPVANAIIARITPKSQQGTTYGIATSLQSAARAIGPLMGSAIAVAWGMRSVFGATGVLYAAMGLAVYLVIRDHNLRPAAEESPAPELAPVAVDGE